jgi:hypothetical protein
VYTHARIDAGAVGGLIPARIESEYSRPLARSRSPRLVMVVAGCRRFLAEIMAFYVLCSNVHASYYAILVVYRDRHNQIRSVTDFGIFMPSPNQRFIFVCKSAS